MLEKDLKLAISEYLEYQMNLGKLWYTRLNCGDFIEVRGNTRRRIRGCDKGTADYVVVRGIRHVWSCTTFLELKSDKGKQSPEQVAFEAIVKEQGAAYHIIRSVDELMWALS